MKTKNRVWIFRFVLLTLISVFYNNCKKEAVPEYENPVQQNSVVKEALAKSGIKIHKGNTCPNVEGIYSAKTMQYNKGSAMFDSLLFENIWTEIKLFNQGASGTIFYSERKLFGLFDKSNEAYISGSGNDFTIWQFFDNSFAGKPALIISGTLSDDHDIVNAELLFVYTEESPWNLSGEWVAANGKIIYSLPKLMLNLPKIISNSTVHLSARVWDWGAFNQELVTETGFIFNGALKVNEAGMNNDSFTMDISDVSPGTQKVAAYIVTKDDEGKIRQIFTQEFLFQVLIPLITTDKILDYNQYSARVVGTIMEDGGSAITDRGHCWSTSPNPTISDSFINNGNGLGSFTSELKGLQPGTTYYVRSFGINGAGVTYGNELSFKTNNEVLVIGESYGGGTIAYIYQSGDPTYVEGQVHGLIHPGTVINYLCEWGCEQNFIGTSTELGMGKSNTLSILNGCPQNGIAAQLCVSLRNGYNDWFFPSLDELNKIYLHRNESHISFKDANYIWSSSEIDSDSVFVLRVTGGSSQARMKKNEKIHFLPLRAF